MPWAEAVCSIHSCPFTGFTTSYCPRCVEEEANSRHPLWPLWNAANWQRAGARLRAQLPRYTSSQRDGAAVAVWGLLVFSSSDPAEFPIHGNPAPPDWVVGDFIYRKPYGPTRALVRFCIQDPLVVAYFRMLLASSSFTFDAGSGLPQLHFAGRLRHQLHYPDGILSDILISQVRAQ